MNKAPLQIYSSALLFAPEKSVVRRLFDTNIPSWVTTRPIMQAHWDPCLATFETHHGRGTQILFFPTGDKFIFLSGREMEIWDTRTVSCTAVYDDVMSKHISFSPDGNDLFYLTGHETLKVMSAATRSCVAEFKGHTERITVAMFSPDGQQLASSSKDGSLKIWNRITGRCTASHQFNSGDEIIGFSPDGASFLIISNKTLQLLNSKAAGRTLTYDNHCQNACRTFFSYESQKLVSIEPHGTIKFTDILTGISLTAEGVDEESYIPLIFLSSGQRVICPMKFITGSGCRDIGIWNTLTATCDLVLEGHNAHISDIILSKDEKRIASASFDKSIRVWDVQSGSCIATYSGHGEQVTSIAYSPDGTLLISLDHQGNSKLWDTCSELQSQNVEIHGSAVLEAIFSPDKKRVVTTAGERTVKLWDTGTGECITTGESHVLLAPVPLVVPHDIPSAPYDHVIDRHDLYGWPRSIQFSHDSSKFVSFSEDLGLKLWNTTTGSYEPLYDPNHGHAISIEISPNNMAVSCASREGTVMYWDIGSKKLLGSFGHKTHDLSFSTFSPDGTYLMLGYENGAVRLYHLPTGKWKDMRATHEGPVRLITMSADGTRLATHTDKIQIWDMHAGIRTAKYETAYDTSHINQILFSPDGRYLAVLYSARKDDEYTMNEKLSLLDASTGDCIAKLGMCGLANHMGFDSNLLTTNVGTFIFDPPTFPNAKTIGLGLSNDGEWITWDSRNLLWLPPTFRISAVDIDVAASLIALGTRLGRLLLIGVDASQIPPPTVALNPLDATNVP